MDVEATAAIRTAEVHSTRVMLDRVTLRNGIEPHIPVWDKTARKDRLFERSDFTYDPEQDRYICPAGKELVQYRVAGRRAKAKRPKDGRLQIPIKEIRLRCLPTQAKVLSEIASAPCPTVNP